MKLQSSRKYSLSVVQIWTTPMYYSAFILSVLSLQYMILGDFKDFKYF